MLSHHAWQPGYDVRYKDEQHQANEQNNEHRHFRLEYRLQRRARNAARNKAEKSKGRSHVAENDVDGSNDAKVNHIDVQFASDGDQDGGDNKCGDFRGKEHPADK